MSARLCFLRKAWLGKNLLARSLAEFNSCGCMTEAPDSADYQLQFLAMWASSTWQHQASKKESYEMQPNHRKWQPISFAILYWLEASHRSCLHSRAGDYRICNMVYNIYIIMYNIIHIVPIVFYIYYRRWGHGGGDCLRVYTNPYSLMSSGDRSCGRDYESFQYLLHWAQGPAQNECLVNVDWKNAWMVAFTWSK